MLIESENASRGPIFGMDAATSYDLYNFDTIPNIRPHRHNDIHIALQENDMTGAPPTWGGFTLRNQIIPQPSSF